MKLLGRERLLARIVPFNAAHYNNLRFGNEAMRFVAPPYDVIDKAMERKLKDDRLNITHITLGNENDDYATASKRLRRWLNDEVMVVDRGKSLYLYEQTFQGMDGVVRVRTGMIAAVRLEEFSEGVILPHENTIPKHKADRRALMEAIQGNTEQVFMLYNDPSGEVERTIDGCRKSEEMLRFIDVQGVHHRIIRIEDEETIRQLCELLVPEKMLIADGHHRYETALEYGRGRASDGAHPSGYVLATLVSFRNPGLVINPTHRLIELVEEEVLEVLSDQLKEEFQVTEFDSHEDLMMALEGAEDAAFGAWCPSAGIRALAVPKDGGNGSTPLTGLSVYVLQERVLKEMLGFTTEMLDKKKNIDYVKEPEVAVSKVASGEHSICFFVKAPTVEQVMDVAKAGLKMPHKSTYFFPKIWSGTVLYLFDEQLPANGK
jgi:uncharacterized protein (DUF1015 family)